MEKNVGTLDAYLRITGGLALLSCGIIHSSKTLALLGSMKVAEGITQFCPILHLFGLNTLDWELKVKKLMDKEEIE